MAIESPGAVGPVSDASSPAEGAGKKRTRGGAAAVSLEPVLLKLGSVALLLVLWWLLSLTLPPTILPGPGPTVDALLLAVAKGEIAKDLSATMVRVFGGFGLAMVAGIAVGILMGISRRAEQTFDMWVMVALTIPGLCYIIVSFMWLGLNQAAAILAIALATFPSIAIPVWEGVKNIDNRLVDMARVFNASPGMRLRRVVLPQIAPYIMASARFGLGITWKVTVLVELLGASSGVGYELHYWFQLYNMPQVFAWTLLFTLIMLFLELVILKQAERRLFAWRPEVRV